MQSGKARSGIWRLEFEADSPKTPEPLIGWTSVKGTETQVVLEFVSREEAVAFAARQGLDYELIAPADAARKSKAYADNFRRDRKIPWSH